MMKLLTAGALAATVLVPPVGPPPSGAVGVEIVTVNGSGCPAGTTAVAPSADNTAFTVTYSQYAAQAGGGIPAIESRKNCQLVVEVDVPQGFTYAIARADYRGFAALEPGATGTVGANYYFQGESRTTSTSLTFSGAMDGDWQVTDEREAAGLVFAPCGVQRNVAINTSLRVLAGSSDPASTSFMVMDSTDGSMSTVYHLRWKRC